MLCCLGAAACTGGDTVSDSKQTEDAGNQNLEDAAHGNTNRLIHEKSPYLLQHAHNPVDWYPWGDEAFEKARREDKPIFLSVGYSTCHWCHVMERESFENDDIAAVLNQHFVAVKVDREERPDVDNLYMTAVQGMTGSGGWPMSVFMTPDLKPFFAGTYFPPDDRYGRPGFMSLLQRIQDAWVNNRDQLNTTSEQVMGFLEQSSTATLSAEAVSLDEALLAKAHAALRSSFDASQGGFGGAPKFPTPHKPRFLLRWALREKDTHAEEMVRTTLDKMAGGGIYDHLGGGFHRYSTDARWLVPHFEKMLYDQAGLAMAYTEAWQATGEDAYRAVAEGTLDYVLQYLTDAKGGFYSAEDADSEGEEGKFYVWERKEIEQVLGQKAGEAFCRTYQVTELGNWEGVNILHTTHLGPMLDADLTAARKKLLARRDQRIRPHLDDKVVTAWNGFMVEAFAKAGWAFNRRDYIDAAEKAAAFIDSELWKDDRLLRHYREGAADVPGYLDDYAFLASGYLAMYEATFKPEHLAKAVHLARDMIRLFEREEGGFYFKGRDEKQLLTPVIESQDGAMPSGNTMAASVLIRLGHLTADHEMKQTGWRTLEVFSGAVAQSPSGFMEMMNAVDFAVGPATELVLAAPRDDGLSSFTDALRPLYLPNMVKAGSIEDTREKVSALISYIRAQGVIDGKPTAYVCRDYACRLPVHDADALLRELDSQ